MTELAESAGFAAGPGTPAAVQIDHADIKYRVYEERYLSARELFSRGFKGRSSIKVHAVKDVSFDVAIGEAVGRADRRSCGRRRATSSGGRLPYRSRHSPGASVAPSASP